jgi:hypothetical protein
MRPRAIEPRRRHFSNGVLIKVAWVISSLFQHNDISVRKHLIESCVAKTGLAGARRSTT